MSLTKCSCCDSSLNDTNVVHQLHSILCKWEAHGIVFSENTWLDYPDNINLTLYQCKNCGFCIFLPMVTGTDAFYGDISKADYYLPDRWDFHIAVRALRSLKAKSVLDVGCGQGAFLALVAKHLPKVSCYGNDANSSIHSKLPPSVKLYTELSEIPDELDAVTLFQVIEHVANPLQLLEESIQKVRSGGLVVVSVPDHSGPIRFFSDSHTAIPPHHVSIWTPKSLEAILNKLGLSIISRKIEPLPDYLMPFYLPKILANKLGLLGDLECEAMLTKRISNPIISLCRMLGIKSLPIPGHTYLVVAKKP